MQHGPSFHARVQAAAGPLAIGLIYFGTAALTLRYTRFDGGVAFIWAGTALLLATLLTVERGRWPAYCAACLVGSFAATWFVGLGPLGALPLALINVGEALIGAWGLQRWCHAEVNFQSVAEIGWFLLIAGLVAPAVTGVAGATVASAIGHAPFWANWWAWLTGHGLGTVTIAPVLQLVAGGDVKDATLGATRRQRLEAVLLLAGLAGVATRVFAQADQPLLFLPFLPLMIIVFKLGRFGAAASALILTVVASYFTLRGFGPIAALHAGPGMRVHFLQFYIATAVLMALPAAGDLRRRKHILTQLEEQSALHKLILDHTGDVIMTLEVDGRVRYVSPSVERLMGRAPAELVGQMPNGLLHPEDVAVVVRVHRQALAEPDRTFIVEYRVVVEGRALGWFETHTRATVGADGRPTGVVSIIRDVSQRKEVEAILERGAHTDALTGLANRRAFDRAMAIRMAVTPPARPAALAIFDLDHFKGVNDRFGHAAGDMALRAFADVLRRAVRDRDLVARIGGEEFVAVLDGADMQQAHAVCERVRRGMAATEVDAPDGTSFRITVSAGICAIAPGWTADRVVAAADAALYRAKAEGRNRLALVA